MMEPLKILFVIPSLAKGGAERMVINMSKFLLKKGHIVKIILFHNEVAYSQINLDIDVVSIDVCLSILKQSKVNVLALQDAIQLFQPDIIHSHLFESEIALAFIKIPTNTRRVVHFHDNMPQFERLTIRSIFSKQKVTNLYERSLVVRKLKKHPTTLISISKHTDFFVRKNLGGLFPILFLPNAIDLSKFHSSKSETRLESISCAMVGSFVDKKGQDLAIHTIHELKKKEKFVKLYLIGDGKNRMVLEELTKKLDLSDRVVFTGMIDHPEEILKETTFYLHTASYEPFGLVIIEAMACGNPVVCLEAGGNVDLMKEGSNGFLLKKRDPKLIAEKIISMIENPDYFHELSKNALDFAHQFDMITYTNNLEIVYRKSIQS